MIEQTFWKTRLKKRLATECAFLQWRGHFERVENAVSAGGPDVDFCLNGVEGKVELKYTDRHPVRSTTPVLGKGNGLRRSQVIWITKRLRAGGRVFVAIGTPHTTWLLDVRGWTPDALYGVERLTAPQLGGLAVWQQATQGDRLLVQALVS